MPTLETKNDGAAKKMPKPLKIVLIVLAVLLALVLLFLGGVRLYFRLPVSDYYKNSEKAFVIPEINSGMIQQGLAYVEDDDLFLITGYKSGDASMLSVVEKSSGNHTKTVKLKYEDGSNYTSHVGGIAVYGDYLYIANGGKYSVDVFSYSDLKNAESGGDIVMRARVSLVNDADETDYVKPSFVTTYGDYLIVGEYYREGNYETSESHHIDASDGTKTCALAVAFNLGEYENGFDTTPVYAYSITAQVQGMTFGYGYTFLSTSYGPSFSHIYAYKTENAQNVTTLNILGTDTEVYALDSNSIALDMKIAPMSEEIEIVDGKLYVMCEAASNKYIFGKFTSAKYCYATDLSKYLTTD